MTPIEPNQSESLDDILDPHRREERASVKQTLAARLQARGVQLAGDESAEDIGNLMDAVERFEHAVEAQGGDLMVDQAPSGETVEPDDPRFVIPVRRAQEAVGEYLQRLQTATDRLWRAD